MDTRTEEIRKLYPGFTDEQLLEIQVNFERYVEIAMRIIEQESVHAKK